MTYIVATVLKMNIADTKWHNHCDNEQPINNTDSQYDPKVRDEMRPMTKGTYQDTQTIATTISTLPTKQVTKH
eukprot:2380400-Amphidinium_carterae.1